jgi:uncharacterized membrane-anchored protein
LATPWSIPTFVVSVSQPRDPDVAHPRDDAPHVRPLLSALTLTALLVLVVTTLALKAGTATAIVVAVVSVAAPVTAYCLWEWVALMRHDSTGRGGPSEGEVEETPLSTRPTTAP